MKTSDIKGIIPPVITPMNNDPEQTVNHQALRQQVERLLAGGVHGIFPLGTNGEAYALSFKEKEEILAAVIDQVKGRVPVYAGTGCITTAETIRMSKRAEEMGADALSIITPSFALASQKELYDHYVAVAKQVNIPIILYNIPPRTGNKLLRKPHHRHAGILHGHHCGPAEDQLHRQVQADHLQHGQQGRL